MALVAAALAEQIKIALNQAAQPTSAETIGMAEAIIEEITSNGMVTIPPGMVSGVAPPTGGPLQNGAASNGLIIGTSGSSLAGKLKDKMGKPSVTSQLQNMGTAISDCINAGAVSFSTGNVTGTCTNTLLSPGAFTGAGTGGLISGLDDGKLADDLATSYGSKSPEVEALALAITSYVMTNGAVTFAMGGMTGTASAGGGPLALGAGLGGTIA